MSRVQTETDGHPATWLSQTACFCARFAKYFAYLLVLDRTVYHVPYALGGMGEAQAGMLLLAVHHTHVSTGLPHCGCDCGCGCDACV